ncbi:MFS transporter [Sphingomonas sp. PAMC 26605]|uniref:MFS transporter n=1 Tax=Sphingomonas sp. PAMC 26605 TaxID=1112214 RepID=UPI0012F4879E|nr:MFS transporter [Sphingomonas sp. PAMC 26605]
MTTPLDSEPATLVSRRLFLLSIGVFAIGGFVTALVSLLVPRLTALYGMDYSHAVLVQLAFYLSYLLFAVPIGRIIVRHGYMRSATVGLTIMAAATALLLVANASHRFALLLSALLLLSCGITFLQIASNTVVAVVGAADGAAFRLNLLQGCNSIGTIAAPLFGASFLTEGLGAEGGPPFLLALVILTGLAIVYARNRGLLDTAHAAGTSAGRLYLRLALSDRRVIGGMAAIFAYVGAEVTIGALLANYLMQPGTLHARPALAARMVSLYWGGAMLGRFAGAVVMRRIAPSKPLLGAALLAAVLTSIGAGLGGMLGSVALIAVGLCNSIMYPTIYVLALPTQPERATPAATLLCMAVVGGAVIPTLCGQIADRVGLGPSLILPALCYIAVAAFALSCAKGGSQSA